MISKALFDASKAPAWLAPTRRSFLIPGDSTDEKIMAAQPEPATEPVLESEPEEPPVDDTPSLSDDDSNPADAPVEGDSPDEPAQPGRRRKRRR